MGLKEKITALGGDATALQRVSDIYRFPLYLYDRIDSGLQGLPVDIAKALAEASGLSQGDIETLVPYLAPSGDIQRKSRLPHYTPFLTEGARILPFALPPLRLAPATQPVVIPEAPRGE